MTQRRNGSGPLVGNKPNGEPGEYLLIKVVDDGTVAEPDLQLYVTGAIGKDVPGAETRAKQVASIDVLEGAERVLIVRVIGVAKRSVTIE